MEYLIAVLLILAVVYFAVKARAYKAYYLDAEGRALDLSIRMHAEKAHSTRLRELIQDRQTEDKAARPDLYPSHRTDTGGF